VRLGYSAVTVTPGSGTLRFAGQTVTVSDGSETVVHSWNCDGPDQQVPAVTPFWDTASYTTDSGRACVYRDIIGQDGGNGGISGVGFTGLPIALGTFGFTVHMRWSMRFSDDWSWGNAEDAKIKACRISNSAETDYGTWFIHPSGLRLEQGYSTGSYYVGSDLLDPATDATLCDWNDFHLEWRLPSTLNGTDGYAKFYRNNELVAERLAFDSMEDHPNSTIYLQWGSMMTQIFPQIRSTVPAGGRLYIDNISGSIS
jgi:hypothetical protein